MLDLAGKILHFQTFGNRVTNAFAVVIAETRHFAYIKYLPQIYTYEDELKYHGTSVPDVSKVEDFRNLSNKELRRGRKYLKPTELWTTLHPATMLLKFGMESRKDLTI